MDKPDPKPQHAKPAVPASREARLAQALRANLRRRKQAGEPTTPADD